MTLQAVLANLRALDTRISQQCSAMTELRGVLDELNAERNKLMRAALMLVIPADFDLSQLVAV